MNQSIFNRRRLFTALAGIVLAFEGFAHAGSIGTPHSQKAEKAKKGTLKIAAASNVGGLRLEPWRVRGEAGEFCSRAGCEVHTLYQQPLRTRGVICA